MFIITFIRLGPTSYSATDFGNVTAGVGIEIPVLPQVMYII
jgi:hypothetical protein